MRRWLRALAAAGSTSGLAIVINIATDLMRSVWAWLAVAALTAASAGFTAWLDRPDAHGARRPTATDEPAHKTHNGSTGNPLGPLAQTSDVTGTATVNDAPRHIRQTAIAFGNSSIRQAGGNITANRVSRSDWQSE